MIIFLYLLLYFICGLSLAFIYDKYRIQVAAFIINLSKNRTRIPIRYLNVLNHYEIKQELLQNIEFITQTSKAELYTFLPGIRKEVQHMATKEMKQRIWEVLTWPLVLIEKSLVIGFYLVLPKK